MIQISDLTKELKILIFVFLIVLSIGFFSGIVFVEQTSSLSSNGISENYLGNEDLPDVNVMKFKKSTREISSIIHSHILSMSVIFFIVGFLLSICKLPKRIKRFLMFEPLLSVLFTFGGIYFLWKGYGVFKYIVLISGILMTVSYLVSVLVIGYQIVRSR